VVTERMPNVALEPAWIGVIGTGIGALATGLPNFGGAVVQAISARGQRKHETELATAKSESDTAEANTQREHEDALRRKQLAVDMLGQRRDTIANWREQLRFARNVREAWLCNDGIKVNEPNVVGDEWFEELRPHLSPDSRYARAVVVNCDLETVTALSIEIGRIEREWTAETQG
jgi:hypothetical protein